MANWTTLKNAIASVIKTNGNQEITGATLQSTLNSIVNAVGENATFKGIATPTTNPGTPDGPVFYFASEAGTYANFGGFILNNPGLVILYNITGTWQNLKVYECLQELGSSTRFPVSQKAISDAFNKTAIYNLDSQVPLEAGFYTSDAARAAVPSPVRKIGLIITYKTNSSTSVTEQFTGDNISYWTQDNKWTSVGTSGGNKILEWNTDAATTRLGVKSKERSAGMIISYNNPDYGWINEQYIGTLFADSEWQKSSNWVEISAENRRLIGAITESYEFKVILSEENTTKDKYWSGGTVSNPTYSSYPGFISLNELIEVKEYSKLSMRRLGVPAGYPAFRAYNAYNSTLIKFGSGLYDKNTDTEIFDIGADSSSRAFTHVGILYPNQRLFDYIGTAIIFNYNDITINSVIKNSIVEKAKSEFFTLEPALESHKYFFYEAFEKQEKIIVTTEENITSGKYWSGGTALNPTQDSYPGFDCITELFDVQAGQRIFFPYIKGLDKAIILFSEGRSLFLSAPTNAVYNEKYNAYEFTIPEGDMYGRPFIKAGINISNQVQENHIGLKIIINACSIRFREQPQKEIKSWINEKAESNYTSLNNKIDTNKDTSFYYLKGASPKELLKSPCILVGGQSNAGGRVPYANMPEEIKSAQPFSNVMLCTGGDGKFSNLNITGSWAFDLIVAYNISKIIQEDSLYLIKYAPGGVSIDENGDSAYHWTADYENIKEGDTSIMKIFEGMIRKCSSMNQNYDIRAMIWHQGEGDRFDGVKELYYYNFKNMIAYIRGIVRNSRMPFIYATQSHNSMQYTKEVEDAQLRIAEEDPYCCCIDMSKATLLDAYHFDATSTKYLGEKMLDALIDYGVIQAEKINPIEPWL